MAVGKNKRISMGKKGGKKKTICTVQPAPKVVHFEDCQEISVRGITLQNSQQHHLTFTQSSNVEANYLRA